MLKKLIIAALCWPLLALAQNFPSPTFKNLTVNGAVTANLPALVTTQTTPNGSVGQGPLYSAVVRSGGYGQYGNWLSLYTVTAATPAPQFDNGFTSWATNENLTGGQIFGGWIGSNTPAANLGQTYTGGAGIGLEINQGNRWANFGLQTAIGASRYTVGLQVIPDVIPSVDGINTVGVICTATSPGVCTLNGNGFYNNMGIVFGGTTVPGGLTAGTTYYVQNVATNTFQVSSTIGGASINFSTTGTAVNVLPSWPGNFAYVSAPSIHGHQWWVATNIDSDTVTPGGIGHLDYGGSAASDAPSNWAQVNGYWGSGLNCTNATFTTTFCVQMGNLQAIEFGVGTSELYGNSGTLTVAGPMQMGNDVFKPNTTKGIAGTTLADNAQAGSVGEHPGADVPIGSAVSLTTATAANVTSVSLSAGDWDCQGNVQYNPAGTTVITSLQAWLSTTSATRPATFETNGYTSLNIGSPGWTGTPQSLQTGWYRVNVSTTTTLYLSTTQAFTTSTMSAYGAVNCRRPR